MSGPKFCSMKITQEVREFARLKEQAAAAPTTHSPAGRGQGEGAPPVEVESMAGAEMSDKDAEAGMAAMSERYRAGGSELYVGAGGREHD
jgi:phosphomethylpyrimidine synthase